MELLTLCSSAMSERFLFKSLSSPAFVVKILMFNHLNDSLLYLIVSNTNSPVTWDVKHLFI